MGRGRQLWQGQQSELLDVLLSLELCLDCMCPMPYKLHVRAVLGLRQLCLPVQHNIDPFEETSSFWRFAWHCPV